MFERIVEEYGIEVVVNRTKISRRNLRKLQNGDFESFSKPQAYGFVRILEREFDEDFSELRSALDTWFSEVGTDNEEIFVITQKGAPPKSRIWVVLILVAAVLSLAFYLFRQEFSPREEKVPAVPAHEKVQATEPEKRGVPPAAEGERESVRSGSGKAAKQPASTAAPASAPAVERNGDSVRDSETKGEEKGARSEPYVSVENAVITPSAKLWFGVIDLETKKHISKVSDEPYEIDSTGKKLLVTGHGHFEISDSLGNLFKFHDGEKHYFLIDDGMVKEIDFDEFKRLNGGRDW